MTKRKKIRLEKLKSFVDNFESCEKCNHKVKGLDLRWFVFKKDWRENLSEQDLSHVIKNPEIRMKIVKELIS